VQPFVLAGVGAMSVVSTVGTEQDEIKEDTDMEAHIGVGVKVALTRIIALRFDARAMVLPNTEKNGLSPDFELMGGLAFTLYGGHGGRESSEPVTVLTPVARDSDGDGIPDADDKCPNAAEDKDGFEDDDGCPDLDNDKDGIPDATDKCPNDPETMNGFEDEDGCPDQLPAAVAKFTGVIKGITFRRNSADIKPSSFPTLKEGVQVLKQYPTLRIEISGHTSNEGKRDFNMKLSEQRAASAKGYLVSAGIEGGRITVVGYGPDKPIADNNDKDGQEKNRRIEFRLVSQNGVAAPPSSLPPPPSTPGAAPAPSNPPASTGPKP
jgi:outer membrane protein OmpA-like peptidoglycan-associated protein